uniref:Uncharacterized protein n=1 Tax=Cannabis sativa TaxID=3483 RepID=A0A803PT30_CANSA
MFCHNCSAASQMRYSDYWGGEHRVDEHLLQRLFKYCTSSPRHNSSRDEGSSSGSKMPNHLYRETIGGEACLSCYSPWRALKRKITHVLPVGPHAAEVITKRRVLDDLETGSNNEAMEEIVKAFKEWAENEAENTFHKATIEKETIEGSKQVTLKVKEFALRVIKEVRTSRCKTTQTPFVAPPSSLSEAQFWNVEELTVNDKVNQFARPFPTTAMYERALALAQLPNFKKDIRILTSSRALDDFRFNFVITPYTGVSEIPRPLGPQRPALTAITKSIVSGPSKKRTVRECDSLGSLLRQVTYQVKGGFPSNTSLMAPPGKCLSTGLSVARTYTKGLMDSMDKTMSRLECLTPAQIIALGCREMIRAATITSYSQSKVLALQEEHDKQGASSLQLELDTFHREHSQKILDLETSVEKVAAENERLKGELASKEDAYTKLAKEHEAKAKEYGVKAKECESLATKMKQAKYLSTDVFFNFWLNNKETDFSYMGKNMEGMLSYCRNREEAEIRQKAHAACIQADSYLNFGVEASDNSPLDGLLDGSF